MSEENQGEGQYWAYLGDIRPSEDNEREITQKSIDRLVTSMEEDNDNYEDPLMLWDRGDFYELLDGHRRYEAYKEMGLEDDDPIPATFAEPDTEHDALHLNINSDESGEDLSIVEQARKWSKAVKVDYVEEGQPYFDYVGGLRQDLFGYVKDLGRDLYSDKLQKPAKSHSHVKRIAQGTEHSTDTVSNRISYILYPESVQENIDDRDGLSKTVAYTVPSRCTDVENAENALDLIGALGEYFEGKGGIDSEKRDIINWSIDHVNETGNVEVITESPELQEEATEEEEETESEEPDEPEEEENQESAENKDKYSIIESSYGDSGLVERIKSYVAENGISKSVVLEMKELTGEDGTASEFQNRLWFDQGDIDELPSEEDDSDEEEKAENGSKESLDDIAEDTTEDEEETESTSDETEESVTTDSEQSDESSESSDTQTEETDESEDMERSEETDEESDTEVHETEYVNGEDDSDDGEMVSVDMDAQTAEVISDVAEQNDSTPAEVLEEVTQPDAIDKMHDGEQSYDEHFSEEEKEMHKHRERRHQALMDHEHTVKMGELKDNWDAYGHAADHIAKAECPHPDCDNGIEHLTWDCHGYSFEEAYGKAQEEYQDAVDDMPSAEEVLKEMDGYKGYTFDPEEDTFEDINNKEKQITEGETDD